MGIKVEIVAIGTYVYITSQGEANGYVVTQTETYQGEPGQFTTIATLLAVDAEGTDLGKETIKVNSDELTEY